MATIESRQIAIEYSDIRALYNLKDDNAIEDMAAIKADIGQLISLVNNGQLSPLSGTGSPEGAIESNISQTYIDTTNSPTSVSMYYNPEINTNTGWIPVV